jgi:hypothetical protein
MGEEATLNEMSICIMGEQATLNEMSIYIMGEQVTLNEMSIYIMGEEVTLNEMSIYIMGEQATLNEMSIYIMKEQVTLRENNNNNRIHAIAALMCVVFHTLYFPTKVQIDLADKTSICLTKSVCKSNTATPNKTYLPEILANFEGYLGVVDLVSIQYLMIII